MKNLFISGILAVLALFVSSCGGSGSSPSTEEPTVSKTGVFKVELTQDFIGTTADDCSMFFSFIGGDGLGNGLKDSATGKEMGSAFVLEGDDAKASRLSFETGRGGLYIVAAVQAASISPETGCVKVTATFYLDGRKLGTDSVVLRDGEEPVSVSTADYVS